MSTRRRALRGAALAAAGAVALSAAALPAHAVGSASPAVPKPPAKMSAVGGARLAKPGVQVNAAAGVPKLPKPLSGRSWMVSDADSGQVLAAANPHWNLPPASTLKMLFADTVLPKLDKSRTVTVTNADLAGMGDGSSAVGIQPGLSYTVHDLWNGVFLRSGNDAVHVLAHLNGGVGATVQQMQAKAHTLGADDTHVKSPDGYDTPGQVSSAFDLTLFARQGLKNADFRSYCGTAQTQFPGAYKKGKDGKKGKRDSFAIQNTNRLLSGIDGVQHYPGIIGVKNGYTTNAGNTVTVAAQRGGHTLLVTVMNPNYPHLDEVYREARALLDWGFAADGKVSPVGTLNVARTGGSAAGSGNSGDVPKQQASADSSGGGGATMPIIFAALGVLVVVGGVLVVLRRRPRASRHGKL
ncbi:D-alanyl-D-alanine carboxypeptidase [Mangrovactinospora gilvigrisea]|uniref:D-alanyl-D-alanine carboxypeptidase n=1 Tax=Mangrovactinospora gilvigrisea TaxID=1428644 RepID=A0A1J7BDB8_9ACTN|nr:serine hydrolase [Mangrovactinospora gilvigrisea]OIV36675.1 D-alanyl-D-alanine carboxypeptidase [Mangrovactinospora gilvigrisea]